MPPFLAFLLWLVLVLVLLCFDPAKDSKPSLALWVPLTWMFIAGSRLPSQWLEARAGAASQALEDGNPTDRLVFTLLILLAIAVLASRSFNWGGFVTGNFILVIFLLFALMSTLWSDFPFICFKRWFRDLGSYLVILVVLSDPRPSEAIRTLLRRFCYLSIPLSILLIKYYPYLGKQYSPWTGANYYVGASTSKNMLGVMCLISGAFFFWDLVTRWPARKERLTKKTIQVDIAFIAMTLWLLNLAHSATSQVCLVLGCLVILAVHSKPGRRNPRLLKALIPVCFLVYVILALGFNINGNLASEVGRDPTLTDRTRLWNILLSMHTNPVVGTGYESFWLGSRLQTVWSRFAAVTEAHNGYLELYLNLGLIGLILLCGFLVSSYRTICRKLTPANSSGSLMLALWTVLLFYNVTEAAFKAGQLMWLTFLLGAVVVSGRTQDQFSEAPSLAKVDAAKPFATLPLEPTGSQR